MSNLSPNSGSNDNNNTNETRDLRTPTSLPKDPPPIGLAGLEAFRREYLTSPLSNFRAGGHSLLPPFPPLAGLPHSTAAALQLAAEGGFGKGLNPLNPPVSLGGPLPPSNTGRGMEDRVHSRGATPPASTQSTPSSEFSSQQNWSFEEQFKQVSFLDIYSRVSNNRTYVAVGLNQKESFHSHVEHSN